VIGKTVNLRLVSGVVLVKGPGGQIVGLTEAQQIATGAVIDARKGALELTSATTQEGKTQRGVFKKGVFVATQSTQGRVKGLVELRLATRDLSGISLTKGCGARRGASLGHAAAKPKPKVLNLLQSDAKGKFRTRGKYAAATVRGTKWDMADRCDGTFTRVHRGAVTVQDLRRHKRVIVRAGHSYLAKP
jgi:hypothetical protein